MFSVITEVWFRPPPISACSRPHQHAGRSCSDMNLAHIGVSVIANSLNSRFGIGFCKVAGSRSSWSAPEIVEAVDGDMVRWGPPGAISTDTRTLTPGQWFFAIVGNVLDAHDFVNLALEDMGCVGVIGNRVCEGWGRGFVRVEGDTLTALEKMATYARNRFNGIVVGLTGSVGKTTTRTMIALALESLGQVYQTPWNHNNQLGVAMTLIGIPLGTQVSVLELGMRGQGEISQLAQMCQPTVRVILNVDHSHLEHFSSLEEIAAAKGELLMKAKPGDICILNADDPLVMSIPVPVGVKKVYFGQKMGCDIWLVLAEVKDGGCAVRVILERWQILHPSERAADMVEFKIHGPGLHLAMNACAAAATAVSFGISLPQICDSLSKFKPVTMRSELEAVGCGVRIINDTYNANFTSMKTAISSLILMECRGKRVAILGDMLELGATEVEAHEAVLNLCCDACVDLLVLVGKRFAEASEKLNLLGKINFICIFDSSSLASKVTNMLAPDDVVLVKGSRAMHMEKVVDTIKKDWKLLDKKSSKDKDGNNSGNNGGGNVAASSDSISHKLMKKHLFFLSFIFEALSHWLKLTWYLLTLPNYERSNYSVTLQRSAYGFINFFFYKTPVFFINTTTQCALNFTAPMGRSIVP